MSQSQVTRNFNSNLIHSFKIFLDVNCSQFNYSSPTSSLVSGAVYASKPKSKPKYRPSYTPAFGDCRSLYDPRKWNECQMVRLNFWSIYLTVKSFPSVQNKHTTTEKPKPLEMPPIPTTRTESKDEAISSSIFRFIQPSNKKISKEALEEAFCRDIDAFNEAFAVSWGLFVESQI